MGSLTRRDVLAVSVVLSGVAGCLSDDASDGPQQAPPYGIHADPALPPELGGKSVVRIDRVAEPARSPLETAIESRYETDAVPDPLAATVADHTHAASDQPYRLEATFPEYVLTLSPAEGSVAPERVAGPDDWEDELPAVSTPLREAFDNGSYRTVRHSDALASFVETHDYVSPDDPVDGDSDVYAPSLTADDPGTPYSLDATAVDWDRTFADPVYEYENLPPKIQAEVEHAVEAIETLGRGRTYVDPYRTDERPAITDSEYNNEHIAYDGTVYFVSVSVA